MTLDKKYKSLLGDVLIAIGILVLAFINKDASQDAQVVATITIFAAVIIRVSGKAACRSYRTKNDDNKQSR